MSDQKTQTPPWAAKGNQKTTPEAPAPEAPAADSVHSETLANAANAAKDKEAGVTAAPAEGEVYVTVTIPKGFQLRLDDHTVVAYKAGIQDVPMAHASHWWSKANGVVEYKAKKPE